MIRTARDLGTGTGAVTLGCPDRKLAYRWLNYVRRASHIEQRQKDEEEERALKLRRNRCPVPQRFFVVLVYRNSQYYLSKRQIG